MMLMCALASIFSVNGQPNPAPEEPKVIIRVELIPPEKEDPVPLRSADLSECVQKYPMPPLKDPYIEDGTLICQRLMIRGQQMQCESDKLINDRSAPIVTSGTKAELANWARCNEKIRSLLVGGYYLPGEEIERRLQICNSNFYADPGQSPKVPKYIRFMDFAFEDTRLTLSDVPLEVATQRLPAPINSLDNTAGLMKCDWMFSQSQSQSVKPKPMPSLAPTKVTKPPPPKKAPVKKTAN
jgi:hypothetical protein